MATQTVESQLEAIQAKLDNIQAELESRNRRLAELEELRDDLTLIAKDMAESAVVELDDVTPFLQTGDLLSLLKKFLRNTNRISQSLEKLENLEDFVSDAEPIGHDLFNQFIHKMAELEQKGYFRVSADAIDVADGLVQVLQQRQVMPAISRALATVEKADPETLDGFSLWKMYRASRTPEVRRLIGLGMTFVVALAKELDKPQET